VAKDGDVGGGRAFAEHLDDRIAGNDVDQEEDDRNHNPEDGERDENPADGFGDGYQRVSSRW
jgi:hypothetical protein